MLVEKVSYVVEYVVWPYHYEDTDEDFLTVALIILVKVILDGSAKRYWDLPTDREIDTQALERPGQAHPQNRLTA